jgi:hypothetical protein
VERARAAEAPHLVSLTHEANAASFGAARKLGMSTEAVLSSPEGNGVHQLGRALWTGPWLSSGPAPGRRT